MNQRSPSVERICAAAVQHFAERGYDAASLNDIAGAVGIKKASLYAHFSGKDQLFLQVFEDALAHEVAFAEDRFGQESGSELPGWAYVSALEQRWQDSMHFRLLLRTAYVPPRLLRDGITEGYQNFCATLQKRFVARLKQRSSILAPKDLTLYGASYLAIVDSLHVELLYSGGQAFDLRLKALRRLLADSLSGT